MGFLSSCGCVNTTVWMHHLEANKTHREKARWELHKNAACSFEQIQETWTHKTVAVGPLTFHLSNNPSKMNKTLVTFSHVWGSVD